MHVQTVARLLTNCYNTTKMGSRPSELRLNLAPRRRFEAIDVSALVAETSDLLRRHQRTLYCSMHTTAGYLDRSLTLRMNNSYDLLSRFFNAFRALFPEGAAYSHDQIDRRTELSEWRLSRRS